MHVNKKIHDRTYYLKNQEKIKERSSAYYAANFGRIALTTKARYLRNRKKRLEYAKKYRESHREKIKNYLKKWQRQNRDKVASAQKEKYHADLQHRLKVNLRTRLTKALQSNTKVGSFVRDLGCTIPELKFYLEGKFKDGMTWDNYGQWHIDHVIPLAFFDLSIREQFLQACHYTNLQPLWAEENLKKAVKVITNQKS